MKGRGARTGPYHHEPVLLEVAAFAFLLQTLHMSPQTLAARCSLSKTTAPTASRSCSHLAAFAAASKPHASSPMEGTFTRPPFISRPLLLDRGTVQRLWGIEPEGITYIPPTVWETEAERHKAQMLELMGGSVKHDHRHPVFNFLFEYYHFKSQSLLDYSAGGEPVVLLLGEAGSEGDTQRDSGGAGEREKEEATDCLPSILASKAVPVQAEKAGAKYGMVQGVGWLPLPGRVSFTRKHLEALRLGREILRTTQSRPPFFFCHGAHEWAMLYHPTSSAHPPPRKYQDSLPLRISQTTLNGFVESRPIRCTHYDAFRFFAPEARPLNVWGQDLSEARSHGQLAHEQPGCLHANMDLFKWAVKLGPYAPSDLLRQTLELAVACRVVDMRASPYDLSPLVLPVGKGRGMPSGYRFDASPIKIETEEGRKEYQAEQQALFDKAQPLRTRLLNVYDLFFRMWEIEEDLKVQSEEV